MSKFITQNFKINVAESFIDSIRSKDDIYYIGAHRSRPWVSDDSPPEIHESVSYSVYENFDDLIFGKHIIDSDVAFMIRNIPWEMGRVYHAYDDRMLNLHNEDFYVVAEEMGAYHVFKCIYNNENAVSTYKPKRSEVSVSDEVYITPDGYNWKYMYTIDPNDYRRFSDSKYVPLFPNNEVKQYAVPGAIDSIVIEDHGSSYYSYAQGNFKEIYVGGNNLIYSIESADQPLSSNTSFYDNNSIYINGGDGFGQIRNIVNYFTSGGERRILIDQAFDVPPSISSTFLISPRVIIKGDGQSAKAKCEVDPANGSIKNVTIIDRGQNYTYADIEIVGNTGTTGVATTTSAVVRGIISPPGGHGSRPEQELYANKIAITSEFSGNEFETIPTENDYRKVSIIKNPKFQRFNIELTDSASASGFKVGETLHQPHTNARGVITGLSSNTVTMTSVHRIFETSRQFPDPEDVNEPPAMIWDANTGVYGSETNIVKYIHSIDKSYSTFDNRNVYTVEMLDMGPRGIGFFSDEIVTQAGFDKVHDRDYMRIILDEPFGAYEFKVGEIITHTNDSGIEVEGKVTSTFNNVVTVIASTGYYTIGSDIIGSVSGGQGTIVDLDNSFNVNASGYIHEIMEENGIVTNLALAGVKGTFLLSDDATNTVETLKGEESQAIAKLISINTDRNKIVENDGDILYIETFKPINRAEDQSEQIRVIIEF